MSDQLPPALEPPPDRRCRFKVVTCSGYATTSVHHVTTDYNVVDLQTGRLVRSFGTSGLNVNSFHRRAHSRSKVLRLTGKMQARLAAHELCRRLNSEERDGN
jgi:hypothetical protein